MYIRLHYTLKWLYIHYVSTKTKFCLRNKKRSSYYSSRAGKQSFTKINKRRTFVMECTFNQATQPRASTYILVLHSSTSKRACHLNKQWNIIKQTRYLISWHGSLAFRPVQGTHRAPSTTLRNSLAGRFKLLAPLEYGTSAVVVVVQWQQHQNGK